MASYHLYSFSALLEKKTPINLIVWRNSATKWSPPSKKIDATRNDSIVNGTPQQKKLLLVPLFGEKRLL